MPLFVLIGDLCIHTWFGVVNILAMDVLLGMSFFDRCIRGIFPSERKLFRCNYRPVANILTQKKVNMETTNTEEADVHTKVDSGTPIDEKYLCRIAHQVTIPAYSQAAVQVNCRSQKAHDDWIH